MNCSTEIHGNVGTLKLEGRFTFDTNMEFKTQTKRLLEFPGLKKIQLDLADIAYLDSNALGMLLLLREMAQNKGVEVVLLSPSSSVMAILDMVQFGKLFTIAAAPDSPLKLDLSDSTLDL